MVALPLAKVCYRGHSGKLMLAVRFTPYDPKPTLMGSTGRRKADIRGAPELVEFLSDAEAIA